MAFSRESKEKHSDQINTKETFADGDEWTHNFIAVQLAISSYG